MYAIAAVIVVHRWNQVWRSYHARSYAAKSYSQQVHHTDAAA